MLLDIQLLDTPLDTALCETFVSTPDAGGTVLFVGTVRNATQARRVLRLEFEAYSPMAIREMEKIGQQSIVRFGVLRVSIHHRTGVLGIGDLAVVIAISAAHRGAAFAACQFCIDTLKETVPIWKREFFEDGDTWVAAHP